MNSLKKIVNSERGERSCQFYYKDAVGESFQVRSVWTFVPQIAQQKLKEFNDEKPY